LIGLNSQSIWDAIINIPKQPVTFLIIGIIGGHVLTMIIYRYRENYGEVDNDFDDNEDFDTDEEVNFRQFNNELKPKKEEEESV